MNLEENRLRTFDAWPAHSPVDPRQLAQCGFFATGRHLEVECNWCHNRISEWQYGEQVEERHRLVDPFCIFLANNSTCENIPLTCTESNVHQATTSLNATASMTNRTSTPTVQQQPDLHVESNRLATFKNWPNPNICPQSLAKAGFFYLNRSDEVMCAWCKGVIAKWEKQDNAFEEHQRFFPDCPRVQLGPLIEIASDGIRELGIQQISPPKKPKFSSLDARLRTYTSWPIGDIQKPEALAQAGLYYQDVDDHVRCFHCNIGLRSWQKEDDPWFEHAKWYPQCQFVKLVKGANYIQEVQNLTRQSMSQQPSTPTSTVMSLDEAMATSAVLQALEIGIDVGYIRTATQRRLLSVGRPYETVEDLVKAVFDDRQEESTESQEGESESEDAGASIMRSVFNSILNYVDSENASSNLNVYPITSENGDCQRECLPTRPVTNISTNERAGDSSQDVTKIKKDVNNSSEAENIKSSTSRRGELSPSRSLSLEEENRKLKDARLCKVCLDDEVGVVFLPCGHLVTCVQCAPGVNHCPMCRSSIKGFVRTYLS